MYNTTKQLVSITPIPQQTRTYKPISHEQLIDLTLESIGKAGFELDAESYSSAREGNVANGRYRIKNVNDSEMQLQIGWQNSYDKSISLKFVIGTHIFICKNGTVFGDIGAFKKKHTGTVQEFTPSAISEYIKRSGDMFARMQKERDQMKEIELTKRLKAELVGRMFMEDEFIQSTQLNIIKKEIENPSFNYECPDSMWELYNHVTHSLKQTHPSFWMTNHIKAHNFFVNASGILVPNTEIHVPNPNEPLQLELNYLDTNELEDLTLEN